MPNISTLSQSRNIRVFISSTFKDMQEERNHLVNNIFPLLRQEAHKRGCTITEVDLRYDTTQPYMAVKAASGMGKSMLLANWSKTIHSKQECNVARSPCRWKCRSKTSAVRSRSHGLTTAEQRTHSTQTSPCFWHTTPRSRRRFTTCTPPVVATKE